MPRAHQCACHADISLSADGLCCISGAAHAHHGKWHRNHLGGDVAAFESHVIVEPKLRERRRRIEQALNPQYAHPTQERWRAHHHAPEASVRLQHLAEHGVPGLRPYPSLTRRLLISAAD